MEIIDTIPVYYPQHWILWTIGGLIIVGIICSSWVHDSDWSAPSFICSGFVWVAVVVLFILMCIGKFSYHHHDVYVVRLDETISATELYNKYEIISKEKYSNVFKVKEKENK